MHVCIAVEGGMSGDAFFCILIVGSSILCRSDNRSGWPGDLVPGHRGVDSGPKEGFGGVRCALLVFRPIRDSDPTSPTGFCLVSIRSCSQLQGDTLCYATVLPGREWDFRAGFPPNSLRISAGF